MQHLLTPYSRKREPFAWWDGAFTEEQLDWLQEKAKEATEQAQVGSGDGGQIIESVSRSELNWLSKDKECAWVFEILSHVF